MEQHDQICWKLFFRKLTAKKGSKLFWHATKPIFNNRGIITNDSILLKKMESLKMTQTKQQKFLIATI